MVIDDYLHLCVSPLACHCESLLYACAYFNETYHSYLSPGPPDTDDIFSVVGLKIVVSQRRPWKFCKLDSS